MTDRARLVLVTPAPAEGEEWPGTLPARLAEALDAGRVDAVVLRLPATDDRTLLKLLKPIVPVVQDRGAALLLQDAATLVARAGADGVHVSGPAGIEEALETLRPQERIVGTAGLRARHDAMEAAEVGVDYVMFGEPRPDGSVPPTAAILERVEWWAEVFQTPCVAFVHDLGDVEAMTATGCEFVALGAAVFDHPAGPADAVRKALGAIASATVPQRVKPGLALAILLLATASAAAQNTPDASPPGVPAPVTPAAAEPGAPEGKPRQPLDVAYGAFQRGLYLTAFNEASKRVAADPTDGVAMTLIGELYANGFGVRQDWAKAGDWYRLAVQRGDPHAAFALGMMSLDGRGVAKDAAAGRRLPELAADAVPAAAYNLALLLLETRRPESDRRAAELMRRAADAGEVDAQYALAVLYRQGKGVMRDPVEGAIWMARAAAARNAAAEVEYGIMLFNGEGVIRNETGAAAFFLRAAEKGNPVAQNRLARLHAAGRGVPRDLVEAAKWHAIAGSRGVKDPWLDETLKGLSPAERMRADDAARRWLGD